MCEKGGQESYLHSDPLAPGLLQPERVGGVGREEQDKDPSAQAVLVMEAPGWEATEPAAGAGLTYRKGGEPQGRGRQRASYPARRAPEGCSGRALTNQWQMMKDADG